MKRGLWHGRGGKNQDHPQEKEIQKPSNSQRNLEKEERNWRNQPA